MVTKKVVAEKTSAKTVSKKVKATSKAVKKKKSNTISRKKIQEKSASKQPSKRLSEKNTSLKIQTEPYNSLVTMKQSPEELLSVQDEAICDDCAQRTTSDTHSYKGWLNSDSFLKRALSIAGYYFVGSLIIVIPFYIIMFVLLLLVIGISGEEFL